MIAAQDAMTKAAQECLDVHADATGARRASEWLGEMCTQWGVPPGELFRLDMCLTEIFANIISHGGSSALASPVRLGLQVDTDHDFQQLELSISDAGQPFDPFSAEIRPQAANLADASPGGLGLTLIRKFSDRRQYAYSSGRNHLTVAVRWGPKE